MNRSALVLLLLATSGCFHAQGYSRATPDWPSHLGKVRIDVMRDPTTREAWDTALTDTETHAAQVAANVLQQLPQTVIVADDQSASADTLCHITVGDAGRWFCIGLPYLWSLESQVSYDVELVDRATGQTRFKAVRRVHFGGAFSLVPPPDAQTLYQRDLQEMLPRLASHAPN